MLRSSGYFIGNFIHDHSIANIVVRHSLFRIRRQLSVDKRTEDSLIYAGLHASQCRIQRSRDAFPLQIHRVFLANDAI